MPKVLLIEDEPDNRDLVRLVLEMAGHEVVEAATGEEGLALARRVRPDAVLTDMSLPGLIDGYEVTRRMRADPELKDLPILAITAHAMRGDRERILEAGCDDYRSKPIEDLEAFAGWVTRYAESGRAG
jgi:two-component system cell cycle response regulator DivK